MRRYTIETGGKQYVIDVKELAADRFRVLVDSQEFEVYLAAEADIGEAVISPEILPAQGAQPTLLQPPGPETLRPLPQTARPALPHYAVHVVNDERRELRAPMPGAILAVEVKPGDVVTKAQRLFVLEAMKMKNPIKSPRDGVIAEVLVQPGQAVGFDDVLARFQEG